jgi:hypothetical protein
VTDTDTQVAPAAPPVTITLYGRHGHVNPYRQGFAHTGGGNIDVAQPAPDTVVLTMTGVAVAGAHPCKPSAAGITCDLEQCFEVTFEKPDVKAAKLTVEGRVIGLLRSHRHGGSAEQGQACATVTCGERPLLSLCVPVHAVTGGDNLSVNCHDGPAGVPVTAGKYTLRQAFHVGAAHPRTALPCKAASAEFAPDPALDPLWISYWEPFHGALKANFGFQVTLRVVPTEISSNLPGSWETRGRASSVGQVAICSAAFAKCMNARALTPSPMNPDPTALGPISLAAGRRLRSECCSGTAPFGGKLVGTPSGAGRHVAPLPWNRACVGDGHPNGKGREACSGV